MKKKCAGTYSMKMMNFKNAGRISTGDNLKDGQQPYTLQMDKIIYKPNLGVEIAAKTSFMMIDHKYFVFSDM